MEQIVENIEMKRIYAGLVNNNFIKIFYKLEF